MTTLTRRAGQCAWCWTEFGIAKNGVIKTPDGKRIHGDDLLNVSNSRISPKIVELAKNYPSWFRKNAPRRSITFMENKGILEKIPNKEPIPVLISDQTVRV